MSSILAAGTVAPNFTLRVTPDQNLTLSDLKGKPVILAFYPADWSPVCGDQVTLYNEILPEFHKHDAELLGISVDGAWCHAAFARDRHLHFPLLADFEPKGEVARKYRAYRTSEGICERALFVLGRQGTIAWSYCSPIAASPPTPAPNRSAGSRSPNGPTKPLRIDNDQRGFESPGLLIQPRSKLRREPWLPSQDLKPPSTPAWARHRHCRSRAAALRGHAAAL